MLHTSHGAHAKTPHGLDHSPEASCEAASSSAASRLHVQKECRPRSLFRTMVTWPRLLLMHALCKRPIRLAPQPRSAPCSRCPLDPMNSLNTALTRNDLRCRQSSPPYDGPHSLPRPLFAPPIRRMYSS
mmetsp:Transcript_27728/g.55790  ORF Transcript_27728/g.55790 Transcript_27728/m.55790 type:complete len:129 (-) Transcript_27728:2473-2859(-)